MIINIQNVKLFQVLILVGRIFETGTEYKTILRITFLLPGMTGHLRALLLVVIGVAHSTAYYPYYPVIPGPDPRIFSPYPVMSGPLRTTEAEEAVTPNPLLERAIYQGRGHWDCNKLETLINKAELSVDRDTPLGPFYGPPMGLIYIVYPDC